MKQYIFKFFGTLAIAGILSISSYAQRDDNTDKLDENERIIIKKKGDKKSKVTVEINDGDVKVNGKSLSDFKDENLSVEIESGGPARLSYSRSPFRTGDNALFFSNDSRPLLGVVTDDHEDGAKVTAVTKGSAAEKAGLKAGDIITGINDIKVENPRELTEAVARFKPEDKVTINIKRDNRTEKLTATLGKRAGANTIFRGDTVLRHGDMRMDDFNFDLGNLDFDGRLGFNRGRLGIKAQDTEDDKGVKVLEVDPDSHAAKSGIKEGDIIYQFDGEEVNSATELAAAAREAREKNNIKVRISREGKSQDIEIKVPKKLKTANL